MFTHKATGAWDALASGFMEAGFTITASWPINTEAEGSLHIKDKSAANSTIFLVCRPRPERSADDEIAYWEDVEPRVAKAVRARVEAHQAAGITGVDLYLSCFGPALEEFAKHWPLKRGTPRLIPARKRKSQESMFGDPADPYFDLDAITEAELDEPVRPAPYVDLDALDLLIRRPELLPPGVNVDSMALREYKYSAPGMKEPLRVTTDPEYFDSTPRRSNFGHQAVRSFQKLTKSSRRRWRDAS